MPLPCCTSNKPDSNMFRCHMYGLQRTCSPTIKPFCLAGCHRCRVCPHHPLFERYQNMWRKHGTRAKIPCSTEMLSAKLEVYANTSLARSAAGGGLAAGTDEASVGSTEADGTSSGADSAVSGEIALREGFEEIAHQLGLRFSWPQPPTRCRMSKSAKAKPVPVSTALLFGLYSLLVCSLALHIRLPCDYPMITL